MQRLLWLLVLSYAAFAYLMYTALIEVGPVPRCPACGEEWDGRGHWIVQDMRGVLVYAVCPACWE